MGVGVGVGGWVGAHEMQVLAAHAPDIEIFVGRNEMMKLHRRVVLKVPVREAGGVECVVECGMVMILGRNQVEEEALSLSLSLSLSLDLSPPLSLSPSLSPPPQYLPLPLSLPPPISPSPSPPSFRHFFTSPSPSLVLSFSPSFPPSLLHSLLSLTPSLSHLRSLCSLLSLPLPLSLSFTLSLSLY